MKITTLIISFFTIPLFLFGQETSCVASLDSLSGKTVYSYVCSLAIPEIGEREFQKLISEQLEINGPKDNEKRSGRAIIGFIVNEDGKLSDFHTYRDPFPSQKIPSQLLEIVHSVEWKPAICNTKPVKSRYYLPVFACLSR